MFRCVPSRGTRTLPHCCASVEGRGVPTGSYLVSLIQLNPENIASWIHSLFSCCPAACLDMHPLAGGDQRNITKPGSQDIEQDERKTLYLCFSLWQVKQKTETRGKDDHMGGREPVENKSSHRKSLPSLLYPRNLFTQIVSPSNLQWKRKGQDIFTFLSWPKEYRKAKFRRADFGKNS